MAADWKASPNRLPKLQFNHFSLLIRMFLSEMLGLGIICFVLVIYPGQPVPGPIVVGLVFTWVVWLCGPISGAQVNPVVSLALFFTRRLSIVHTLVCIAGQIIGATAGAWIGKLAGPATLWESDTVGMTLRSSTITVGQAVGLEIIATAMLILSVLAVSDEFRGKVWSEGHVTVFAFEFGVTLALLASVVGGLTGGSMNPARSIGPAFVNNNYTEQWIYWVGPFFGMLLATLLYEMVLSDGASLPRLKAWFTHSNFDRTTDYKSTVEADPDIAF